MDRNSIIGFVLIALIMMGFFGYQSRQARKQLEYQAHLDSLAAVEAARQDSIRAAYLAEHPKIRSLRPCPRRRRCTAIRC